MHTVVSVHTTGRLVPLKAIESSRSGDEKGVSEDLRA